MTIDNLKSRLAAIRQQQKIVAPSFSPAPRKTEEDCQDISEYGLTDSDLANLRDLVEEHVRLGQIESGVKRERKPVIETLKSICQDYQLSKAVCWGRRLTYFKTTRSSISVSLLLGAGVSPRTIKACTVRTDSWSVRVTTLGEEADEDVGGGY